MLKFHDFDYYLFISIIMMVKISFWTFIGSALCLNQQFGVPFNPQSHYVFEVDDLISESTAGKRCKLMSSDCSGPFVGSLITFDDASDQVNSKTKMIVKADQEYGW